MKKKEIKLKKFYTAKKNTIKDIQIFKEQLTLAKIKLEQEQNNSNSLQKVKNLKYQIDWLENKLSEFARQEKKTVRRRDGEVDSQANIKFKHKTLNTPESTLQKPVKRYNIKDIQIFRQQLLSAKTKLAQEQNKTDNLHQKQNLSYQIEWLENKILWFENQKKTSTQGFGGKNRTTVNVKSINNSIISLKLKLQKAITNLSAEYVLQDKEAKQEKLKVKEKLKIYLKDKTPKTKEELNLYKQKKKEFETEYTWALKNTVGNVLKIKKLLSNIRYIKQAILAGRQKLADYTDKQVKKRIWELKKKQSAYEFKRIKHKWRKFFVIKKWYKRRIYKKKLELNRFGAAFKNKKKLNLKSRELVVYTPIIKKHSYRLFVQKGWKAIKRKKKKKWSAWYNFNFFFMKFFTAKNPKYGRYSGVINKKKFNLLNNPGLLWWHPNQKTIVKRAQQFINRVRPYKRLPYIKKTHWKKLTLKRFFMGLYFINALHKLKVLVQSSQNMHGHKQINFFLALEARVVPTCYRMNFFNTQRRALNWIYWGFVYKNGCVLDNANIKININAMIRIISPNFKWQILTFKNLNRSKKSLRLDNLVFFYYELGLCYYIGVVLNIPNRYNDVRAYYLKKKKRWLQLKVFSYIANAYY